MPRKQSPRERDKVMKDKSEMFELMSETQEDVKMCFQVKKELRDRLNFASKESRVPQSRIVNMSILYYLSEAGY